MTNGEIVAHGTLGTTATLGGWFLSHVHQINESLQTVSLCVGLSIGGVSLVRLLRKRKTPPANPET